MRSPVTALCLAAALLLSAAAAEARTKLAALPDRESATVRFDNPAATLVEEERVLTLQEGENLVDFAWRGVSIDPDSIRLAVLSHPDKVTLLSVSYPPGEPALVWRIHSAGAWTERVRISYLLSAIDRVVAYRGVAAKDEKSMDLSAFLVLRNFSGEDFTEASFDLGQGEPFRGGAAHEETRQVLFLTAEKVAVRKTLTWDSEALPWEPARMDASVGIPVHYVLKNTKDGGLGRDLLWGGKVRVFGDDGHGKTIFLGEDGVPNVPVGEEMKIYIGDSREVSVTQRKVRDARVNPRPSRQKVVLYDTEEEVVSEVQNFKDSEVTVDLVQHVRGEWVMTEASAPYERKDANTVVFSVKAPAKGKAGVSFSYSRRNIRN